MQLTGFRTKFNCIWLAVFFSGIFWIGDSFVDYFFFGEPSYFEALIPDEAKELWMRILLVFVVLLFGTYMQYVSNKEARLLNDLKLGAVIFEDSIHALMVTDNENCIVKVNPTFEKLTGYTSTEVFGKNPRILQSGKHDRAFFLAMWEQLLRDGRWEGELWDRRKNGETYLKQLSITLVRDEDGGIVNHVGIFRDISYLRKTEEQLGYLAHHDPLTGLPNRMLLDNRLDHALQHAQRENKHLAILFIDLDRFKNINDTLGHPTGDQLLQQVAERLVGYVREEDTVARLGGDELTIVLEDLDKPRYAATVAQGILDAMAKPFKLDEHEVYVSASIGISIYPEDGKDVITLLKHADAAMYMAKKQGRKRYRYYQKELTEGALEFLTLESDLHRALEREEFVVYYQPQVCLQSGEIVGVEALVRWQHPENGMISPGKFIPMLEETGLIIQLDEYVLQEACKCNKAWQDAGLSPIRMSVNLSARHFDTPTLVQRTARILEETGLAPGYLELELTESAIMQDVASSIEKLRQLDAMGISLAIDDFGTGYSSLSYLQRFPVDTLKIDRSFIRSITRHKDDLVLTQMILGMTRALQLSVVAEGVESEEQLRMLIASGCDIIQGFYFSRPQPADKITAMLQEDKRLALPATSDGPAAGRAVNL